MTANIPSVHLEDNNCKTLQTCISNEVFLSFFVRNMRVALKVKCAVGMAGVNEDG